MSEETLLPIHDMLGQELYIGARVFRTSSAQGKNGDLGIIASKINKNGNKSLGFIAADSHSMVVNFIKMSSNMIILDLIYNERPDLLL